MFIQLNRLNRQMEAAGFHLWLADEPDGEFRWSRPSCLSEIFEHVWITVYGEGNNTVGSFSAVSVIAGPEPCDGLYIEEFHESLCSEKRVFKEPSGRVVKDYHTIIKSTDHALAWEAQLVEIGVAVARRLTNEHGNELLQISQDARIAAKQYRQLIRNLSAEPTCDYLEQHLRERLAAEQQHESDRWANAAVGRTEFLSAFQAAAAAIQLFATQVEGSAWPRNSSYSEDKGLVWRLSILADILMRDSVASSGDTVWCKK